MIDQLEQQYGANTVREGGLQVYTTIDPRLQYLAKKAINDILPYKTDPAAAIVSVEPGTGAIRAMTAVVRTKGNQFNLVAQSTRQAGSTFKTFVLAAAIEKGIDPDSTYYVSAPFTCTVGPWCSPNDPWQVHTYGNTYLGSVSVTRATLCVRQHRLRPADARRRPEERLGDGAPARRADVARTTRSRRSGSGRSRSTRSTWRRPTRPSRRSASTRSRRAIEKVVLPGGKVDSSWGKPTTKRVLVAGRRVEGDRRPAPERRVRHGLRAQRTGSTTNAGKTGTTENHEDAWFDGYTRQLSTVVWMGYPSGEIPMLSVHGQAVAGATFDVPIWHEYMAAALKHRPALAFALPKKYPTFEYLRKGDFGSLAYTPTTTLNITTPITGGAPPGAGPH